MDPLIVILITLLMSAFFSGIEIAFISSSKLRIELKNKQGHYPSHLVSGFLKAPSRFISTTLLGNTIALVIYGIYMGTILKPKIESALPDYLLTEFTVLAISTLISALIVLIIGKFIPKVIFMTSPDLALDIMIFPFMVFSFILSPVVHFITVLSRFILSKISGTKYIEDKPVFSRVDLDNYLSESSNDEEEESSEVNTEILRNALDFANVKVRECMRPRPELVALDVTEPIEELYRAFTESGHSKILIYNETIDNIIGYVHQVDLFKKPANIKSILLPIIVTTEFMPANELLKQFTQARKSIALVVDEFGGTAGIVTIEDVMEEIFGEIDDEYDIEHLTEKQLSENEYIFNARLEIDYLNDKYPLDIPYGEYETLGGYIISEHESIPQPGEMINIERFEFRILSVDNNRIKEVNLRIRPE